MASLCTVTGQVLNAAGSAFANGSIAFDSVIGQTVGGNFIPASTAVATTDGSGNINGGSGITLVQGLFVRVSLTLNGNMYSQFTAVVPSTSTTTFASLISGVQPFAATVTSGTFTPAEAGSLGNPVLTGALRAGVYTQVGPIVHVSFQIGWSGVTSPGSGSGFVANLPFTAASVYNSGALPVGTVEADNAVLSAGYTMFFLRIIGGQAQCFILEAGGGSGFGGFPLPVAQLWVNQPSNLYGTISYRWQ